MPHTTHPASSMTLHISLMHQNSSFSFSLPRNPTYTSCLAISHSAFHYTTHSNIPSQSVQISHNTSVYLARTCTCWDIFPALSVIFAALNCAEPSNICTQGVIYAHCFYVEGILYNVMFLLYAHSPFLFIASNWKPEFAVVGIFTAWKISKCYKPEFDLLPCWLSEFKEAMEQMQIIQRDIKTCCVCSHCMLSSMKVEKIFLLYLKLFSSLTEKLFQSLANEWSSRFSIYVCILLLLFL